MKTENYKFLPTITMVYMCIMICAGLLVNKIVAMPFGVTTAATFVFPLWFILNDIIAEVYGYFLCQRILLTAFIVRLCFDVLCYGGSHLPSPVGWNDQASFDLILGHLLRITLTTLVSYLISGYINIYLLTKWKILTRGKFFWLRSIGSSILGEACYCFLNVWGMLLGTIAISKIPSIIFWSFTLKVIYTVFLAYPATLIVGFLKEKEGIDVYDNTFSFNPFRGSKEVAN